MSQQEKRPKGEPAPSNSNYFLPLQALSDDEDKMDVAATTVNPSGTKKVLIPPITVLKRNTKNVLEILQKDNIKDIIVKKISIGTKIMCQTLETYKMVKALLNVDDVQHFTHDLPSERSFKVVLYGLEGRSASEVENALRSSGFKCKDAKLVTRTRDNFNDAIFIVSFENGTTRLHDLKQKVKTLFSTIVRWDFKRKLKNKVTQCRRCQMFGHGERGCRVKLLCATCAGNHATADCKSENKLKCANCHGNHKSTYENCPNRLGYLELRKKISQRNYKIPATHSNKQPFIYADDHFPKLPSNFNNNAIVNYPPASADVKSYANVASVSINSQQQQSSSILFTEEEITKLTFDLIVRLRECTNKGEQFNVITQLAIKYVYAK